MFNLQFFKSSKKEKKTTKNSDHKYKSLASDQSDQTSLHLSQTPPKKARNPHPKDKNSQKQIVPKLLTKKDFYRVPAFTKANKEESNTEDHKQKRIQLTIENIYKLVSNSKNQNKILKDLESKPYGTCKLSEAKLDDTILLYYCDTYTRREFREWLALQFKELSTSKQSKGNNSYQSEILKILEIVPLKLPDEIREEDELFKEISKNLPTSIDTKEFKQKLLNTKLLKARQIEFESKGNTYEELVEDNKRMVNDIYNFLNNELVHKPEILFLQPEENNCFQEPQSLFNMTK